jgi:Flp pilus assembly CpaE family ATPase
MMHTPKLEYYNFLDKVRKMNKNEVQAHIVKLRMHYKGEEMLEVFENAFGADPVNAEENKPQPSFNISAPQKGGF